jgi:hypothetical protein
MRVEPPLSNPMVKRRTHARALYMEMVGKMAGKIIGVNTGKEKAFTIRKQLKL